MLNPYESPSLEMESRHSITSLARWWRGVISCLLAALALFVLIYLLTKPANSPTVSTAFPLGVLAAALSAMSAIALTIYDAARHCETRRSLGRWCVALLFVQLPAVFVYWFLVVRKNNAPRS